MRTEQLRYTVAQIVTSLLMVNTLAYIMLSSRFHGINGLRYNIAVITGIIQSEMTDLLMQGMDVMTETPGQYVSQYVEDSKRKNTTNIQTSKKQIFY